MLKAAASCILASRKALTYSEYASALLSVAALLDDSFEHPAGLSMRIETDSANISLDTAARAHSQG
jgi:hypothetical protein